MCAPCIVVCRFDRRSIPRRCGVTAEYTGVRQARPLQCGAHSGLVGNVPIGVFPVRNGNHGNHGRRRIYNIQDSVISLSQSVAVFQS